MNVSPPLDSSSALSPLVVGGGPASAALVLALAGRGLRASVVDPRGVSSSTNTLCAFADQLPSAFVAEHFERTIVVTSAGEVDLGRPYARVDSTKLAAAAADNCAVVVDSVVSLAPGGRGVITAGGIIDAAVVVDASGHRPLLVDRQPAPAAFQSAFGLLVRGRDASLPPGTALFMDWRSSGVDDGGPPSFLYALSGHDGRLLLEETTLASTTAVAPALLKARLQERLRRRGTQLDENIADEEVLFPMGGGLPRRHQAVAAFGAAAGLVQPVSGYSVARAFAAAPRVADVIFAGIAQQKSPLQIADDVDGALWPASARAVHALQRYGLAALCGFSAADNDAFFGAFFELPARQWRGFLDGDDDVGATRSTMWRLFRDLSPRLRRRLVRGPSFKDTFDVIFTAMGSGLTAVGGSPS